MNNLPQVPMTPQQFQQYTQLQPGQVQEYQQEVQQQNQPKYSGALSKEQQITYDATKIKNYITHPFPFRFRVYQMASALYCRVAEVTRHLPKDMRSSLGEEMLRTYKNLLKDIDRTNNERDLLKRIKGWTNCHFVLNSASADIVLCIKNNYIPRDKFAGVLKASSILTKSFLHLISIENLKLQYESGYMTNKQKEQAANEIAKVTQELMDADIDNKDRGLGPIHPYIKEILKDPDPNNNPNTNNMNAVLVNYGLATPGQPTPTLATTYNHIPDSSDVYFRNAIARQQYIQLNQQLNTPGVSYVPPAQNLIPLAQISRKDDITINRAYNTAIGLTDTKNLKSPVQRDYFKNSRIALYNNDIPRARAEFKKQIAFK